MNALAVFAVFIAISIITWIIIYFVLLKDNTKEQQEKNLSNVADVSLSLSSGTGAAYVAAKNMK